MLIISFFLPCTGCLSQLAWRRLTSPAWCGIRGCWDRSSDKSCVLSEGANNSRWCGQMSQDTFPVLREDRTTQRNDKWHDSHPFSKNLWEILRHDPVVLELSLLPASFQKETDRLCMQKKKIFVFIFTQCRVPDGRALPCQKNSDHIRHFGSKNLLPDSLPVIMWMWMIAIEATCVLHAAKATHLPPW